MTGRLRSLLALALTGVLSACSLQTAGGPMGDRTFVARFDDVQHLVVGHSVRLSDITVGTVTSVRLDGFDAVVEFSVVDDRDLPVGTTASISSTSLLGENYLRLTLPSTDPGRDLADGAELAATGADASFEELTLQLLALTRAVQGRDVATVIDAGARALGGRGEELNALLVTLDEIGDGLVRQRDDLDGLLSGLGVLGRSLAPDAAEIGDTIELAADAAGTLAEQRDRLVATVDDITALAATLDAEVLAPHRATLDRLLADLAPVVSTLAADVDTTIATLEGLIVFNERVPRATGGGELVAYSIFDEFLVGGQTYSTTELAEVLDQLLHPDPDQPPRPSPVPPGPGPLPPPPDPLPDPGIDPLDPLDPLSDLLGGG